MTGYAKTSITTENPEVCVSSIAGLGLLGLAETGILSKKTIQLLQSFYRKKILLEIFEALKFNRKKLKLQFFTRFSFFSTGPKWNMLPA